MSLPLPLALVACCLVGSPAAQEDPLPPPVAQRLGAEDSAVRRAVLADLAEAGPEARDHAEAIALTLGDPEEAVRLAAVEALVAVRPDLEGVREDLESLVRAPEGRRVQVLLGGRAFGLARPARLTAIAERLDADDPQTRREAVAELCGYGDAAAVHLDRLLELLDDPDADVRAAVAGNIGRVSWDEEVRGGVLQALKDISPVVRKEAAETLGEDRDDPGIVAALRGVLQDPDLDVRAAVARSLGRCGEAGRAAAADILATLRDREPKVRVAALESVRRLELRGERAVGEVLRCLDDQDPKVLRAALQVVENLGEKGAVACPRILELTDHTRPEIRERAVDALWSCSGAPQRGTVVLRSVEALADEADDVASSARKHLRTFALDDTR